MPCSSIIEPIVPPSENLHAPPRITLPDGAGPPVPFAASAPGAMTSLNASATAVAFDSMHTQMAVFDEGAARLAVYQRSSRGGAGWTLSSSVPTAGLRVTVLCWAPCEHGCVVAGGAVDGSLAIWAGLPGEGSKWQLVAVERQATLAVQDVAFAPAELGPLLAVAYADGFVRCVRRGLSAVMLGQSLLLISDAPAFASQAF